MTSDDDTPSIEYCSATDVRRSLSSLLPNLVPYWTRRLGDYAGFVYGIEAFRSENEVRLHAMDRLRHCIERAALKSGFNTEQAISVGADLVAAPVMQTGPHALLLLEPDAFYTHLFSLLGLLAHGRRWHITYSVSTSAFRESAKKGPGWLPLNGEALNVFGLPRKRLVGTSIACENGPYRYALSNSQGEIAPSASARRLLDKLPKAEFRTGAEAIKMGNQALWKELFAVPVNLLQLDDFDMADLIADHLEDPSSWLSAHFVGGRGSALTVLQEIDRLNAGPWEGWIRRTTDLFWGVAKDRVFPLYLNDGVLRSARSPGLEVSFTPECLAQALRDRTILPGMFMSYLATAILPGVRVLGGCRQTVYLPLMRHLAAVGFDVAGDRDFRLTLKDDERPGVWGHRVLKPVDGQPFQEIEAAAGILPLLTKSADLTLEDASGNLSSFTRDPIWAEMSASIASGSITPKSREWQWSGL